MSKRIYIQFVTVALSIFLTVFAHAETLHVQVQLGLGRVLIQTDPSVEFEKIKSLQTELLLSDKLSSMIVSDQLRELNLTIDAESLTSSELEAMILDESRLNRSNPSARGTPGMEENPDWPQRIIFGEEAVIGKNESIGELVVVGGEVEIYGRVDRLVAIGAEVRVHSSGQILSDVESIGSEIIVDPGAQMHGKVQERENRPWWFGWSGTLHDAIRFWNWPVFSSQVGETSWSLMKLIVLVLIALIMQRSAPRLHNRLQQDLKDRFWACWGWGIASLFFILPIIVGLVLTLVGIFLIPGFLLLMFFGWLYGYVLFALWVSDSIGEWHPILRSAHVKRPLVQLLLGLLVVEFIGQLSGISYFVVWFASLAGLGAFSYGVVVSLGRRRRLSTSPA